MSGNVQLYLTDADCRPPSDERAPSRIRPLGQGLGGWWKAVAIGASTVGIRKAARYS